MNWLSIGDLLARHSDKRIATAADARVEAVEALRTGVVPDDPDVRAEAVEVAGGSRRRSPMQRAKSNPPWPCATSCRLSRLRC